MTTYEWPGVIHGFDVLKWKAETQARILRETEGTTDEEVREYFRQGAERFDEETKQRRAERELTAAQMYTEAGWKIRHNAL